MDHPVLEHPVASVLPTMATVVQGDVLPIIFVSLSGSGGVPDLLQDDILADNRVAVSQQHAL